MKNPRMIVWSAIGIVATLIVLCFWASAADLSADSKPAAVDAAQYADFMANETLDIQDLAEGAEIQRRMFNRITPPGISWFQPMFPPVVPFDTAFFDEKFLEALLGEDKNSVAIYPLSLALDPKTRETLVYNADGKLIAAVSKNNAFPASPFGEDPSRIILRLDLLPSEDVEPYLYTESRVADSLDIMDEEELSGGGGMAMMSLESNEFGFVKFESLSNGTMRLTVTNSAGTAEVFSYTVWHTSDVVVVTWTNEESNVVTDTNTLWYPVSPPYNGMESAWTNRTTNLACTNGVGVWEDQNIVSNERVRFYAVTLRTDSDEDDLTDGAEYFVYHTNPGTNDTDADGLNDYAEVVTHLTNPLNSDTDSDGMTDGWEVTNGLNPLIDDGAGDGDVDGLSNLQEFLFESNPQVADTDQDGLADGEEIYAGLDPTYNPLLYSQALWRFAYDSQNRLTAMTSTVVGVSMAYDDAANLTTISFVEGE